jgi:hypothetical protein
MEKSQLAVAAVLLPQAVFALSVASPQQALLLLLSQTGMSAAPHHHSHQHQTDRQLQV